MDTKRHYPGKELEAMSYAVNYHRWILDEIRPYLEGNLVEVGAGKGDFTRLILETAAEKIFAFEPSPELFGQLKDIEGDDSRLVVVNDFLNQAHLPCRVDSVLYINVLEHIEDDRAELRTVSGLLAPGSSLLLFVPALSWLFSDADRSVGHFRRYHRKQLVKLVEDSGFSVEKVRYFDMAGILPWYVNFVLLKSAFRPGAVAVYDRLVVPPMKRVEKWMTPPVGKNLLLAARKI